MEELDIDDLIIKPINRDVSRAIYAGLDVLMYTSTPYKGYINASKLVSQLLNKNGNPKKFCSWMTLYNNKNSSEYQFTCKIALSLNITIENIMYEKKGDH